MDKLKMQTQDLADQNFRKLAELFPNAVTETVDDDGNVVRAIDKDVLMQEINTAVVEGRDERYQFTWPDKRKAIIAANAPTTNTLRPLPEESESVDFWNTQNLYIEGDNLEVLKLLQENYLGKVKMIYIDPPYNTGNDFVYEDDFAESTGEYLANSGQYDEEGNRLVQNTESNGRFHTDWLNMIYPRLKVARNLLTEDGVIFISIDDNEVENLRKICDDVFGEQNFVAQFIWKKKQGGGNDSNFVVAEHEYIICYSKSLISFSLGLDKKYKLDDNLYPFKDEKGDYGLITLDKASIQISQSLIYEIEGPDGEIYYPRVVKGKQSCWRWSKDKVKSQYNDLVFKNGKVYTKYYRPEGVTPKSLLIDSIYGRTESGNDDIKALFQPSPFSYPKPVDLIKHFISITKGNDFIALDFFSGSATTAHAIMQLNAEDGGKRKFIMVQLPEETAEDSEAHKAGYKNICEIGKERIRRAGKKIKEESPLTTQDLDTGFRVLRLDSSNMEQVYYTPEETVSRGLFDQIDNIKPDRNGLDLLFQAMLELGVPLSAKIETSKIADKTLYAVEGNYIMASFDTGLTDAVIADIAQRKPYYFVMRDAGMADDSVAVNFEQLFKSYSPDTILKVF